MLDSKVNQQNLTHTRNSSPTVKQTLKNSQKNEFVQLQFERKNWSQPRGHAWSRFRIRSHPKLQKRIISGGPCIQSASKELDSGKIR
jgi:hypothetical protein